MWGREKSEVEKDMETFNKCPNCNDPIAEWKVNMFNGKCEDCWYEDRGDNND